MSHTLMVPLSTRNTKQRDTLALPAALLVPFQAELCRLGYDTEQIDLYDLQ